MKKYKSSLYIAAFVFLICVFTPYGAHAQDDGPVPLCNSLKVLEPSPWPCFAPTPEDGPVPLPYQTLAQNGGLIPQPYDVPAPEDGFALQLHSIFAGITPSMGSEIPYRHVLFEGRRQEFALIRNRLMDTSAAHIRISAAVNSL